MTFIEIHIRGKLRYRWQVLISDLPGSSWQDRVEVRQTEIDDYLQRLQQYVSPNFDVQATEYFIVYQSKMNDETV